MDQDLCDGTLRDHAGAGGVPLVRGTAFPAYLASSQYALYRLRYRNTDNLFAGSSLVCEDTQRLQNMPTSGEVHHASRHAL